MSRLLRIVLLEDDAGLSRLLVRFLTGRGHEVRHTSRGREAIDWVESWPADLLVTDVNMPDMDGIEVLMELRRTSVVPIVVISGGGLMPKELLLGNAEILGASAVLEKPFELADFEQAIDDAITGRGDDAT